MEKIQIKIENRQTALQLNLAGLKRLIRTILKLEGITAARVAFVFVSRREIQSLNKKFLNRTYSTDVLAFDLRDTPNSLFMADIVISTDAAVKQSKKFGNALPQELALYIIHGILHLNGFDDHSPGDISKMRKAEEQILAKVKKNIKNILA